jgi:hypothetical protein
LLFPLHHKIKAVNGGAFPQTEGDRPMAEEDRPLTEMVHPIAEEDRPMTELGSPLQEIVNLPADEFSRLKELLHR